MESLKVRASIDTQESKTTRLPANLNKRSSFHTTVIRTQNLMRVLKTMNTVSEIKREDIFGLNLDDLTQNHRRSGRTLDKVYKNCCRFAYKTHPSS